MDKTSANTIKHGPILKAVPNKSREKASFHRLPAKFICKIKEFPLIIAIVLLAIVSVMPAESAYAFQAHSSIEGLYAHQFSHILYAFSLVWLVYRIKKSSLIEKRAWRLLSIGMFILTVWNLWAFCGHIIEYELPSGHLVPIPGTDKPGILMTSWMDAAYYILKLDNLISVPAMWLIYLGLADMKKALK